MKSTLALIMPVYNEEEGIEKNILNWKEKLDSLNIDYKIHAYNDGSKDATLRILLHLQKVFPTKIIVHDKKNSGHGPTILLGYQENSDSEWIFQTDSDGEMSPDYFYLLWQRRENYDFLIGKRSQREQNISRKIISFISRLVIFNFYGKQVYDVNSPYRLLRTQEFKELFLKTPDNTFAPNLIVSGYASLKKMRIFQIAVPHTNRVTGTVSIKKFKLLKSALKAFLQTMAFRFTLKGL